MLRGMVAAIHAAADEFGEAERRLATADPGATAFGAGGLGLFGDLGREAYRHWEAALHARSREAVAHEQRLRELADVVERAGGGLAEAHDVAIRDQRQPDAGDP